jgi:predicted permease
MTPRLPRLVVALLRRVVPHRTADQLIDELSDDYAERWRTNRRGSGLWLAGETLSIVAAYVAAALRVGARRAALTGRDVRHAWRVIRRHPVQSLASAAMLGCGISGLATVAGLTATLLGRPVSPEHGARVVRLAAVDREGGLALRFSYAELDVVRRFLGGDVTLAAVDLQPVVLKRGTGQWQALGEVVTSEYFGVVGQRVVAGRPLRPSDDRPDAPPVAVIGRTTWRDRFGESPSALGSEIVVNTTAFTIVGVSESRPSTAFAAADVHVWIPTAHGDAMLNPGWRTDPTHRWWTPVALTPSGATPAIETQLRTATRELARRDPRHWQDRVLTLQPGLTLLGSPRATATTLLAVLGALAVLMLAVASANVGGLWLAASAADRRQLAVHLALGASRATLVGRRVAAGMLVGVAAGSLALAAYAGARVPLAAVALQPAVVLRLDLPFNLPTAVWIVMAAVCGGGLLAIGPALWASRLDVPASLSTGSSRGSVATMSGLRRLLVSVQVALSLTLTMGAATFSRSAARLTDMDTGFPRDGLVAMDFDVEPAVEGGQAAARLARQAIEQVRRLPGITGAAMANRAPIDPSTPRTGIRRPGDALPAASATLATITDGYFETVGIPIVSGRDFTADEIERSAEVAIVNEALASRLWPDGDVVNRALVLDTEARSVRVVGVARDARYRSLSEAPQPHVYVPTAPGFSLALLARANGDDRRALVAIQDALDRVGPGVVGFFPRTMDDHLSLELLPVRAAAGASAALGATALALSAAGLYALVAWFVEIRRREIGVRLALGASSRSVGTLVVSEALRTAVPGALVGLLASLGLAAIAGSMFADAAVEPAAAAAGVFGTAALILAATYVPYRRAARVDPAESLREG